MGHGRTDAMESLNRLIRKSIKMRDFVPTDEAATKLIDISIRNSKRMAEMSGNGLPPATSSP